VAGNERVLRARLADAEFFFETDQKQQLESRIAALKGIVFQAKLGSLYDKTQRLINLANQLATLLNQNAALATRAALLAKADLTTGMVGEFPELQGVMGRYYALHDKEPEDVATAIEDHYKPRFSGDLLPKKALGRILAVADRIDTLIGIFGVNQQPTGDKDPYGLRRAALGLLRILIEEKIDIDLLPLLTYAASCYGNLENKEAVSQSLRFIIERLKGLCQEHGIDPDVFAAVAALGVSSPYDFYSRLQAVQVFKRLPEAEVLAMVNKRVNNILTPYEKLGSKNSDPHLFETSEEKNLFDCLQKMQEKVVPDLKERNYTAVMMALATLRDPLDKFFDHVLVMVEDKKIRENRLLLLKQLRELFFIVADITFLTH
jgi:glycyl-tRNA synthetase beta chain